MNILKKAITKAINAVKEIEDAFEYKNVESVPQQYYPPPMPPVKEPKLSATSNCTYSTPCGWCTKWDKECDRKIGCNVSNIIEHKKFSIQDYLMEQSVVSEIIEGVIKEEL